MNLPILNPSRDAILATLHPKKTDYLFFIASFEDFSRARFFETHEEHINYKNERKRFLKKKQ